MHSRKSQKQWAKQFPPHGFLMKSETRAHKSEIKINRAHLTTRHISPHRIPHFHLQSHGTHTTRREKIIPATWQNKNHSTAQKMCTNSSARSPTLFYRSVLHENFSTHFAFVLSFFFIFLPENRDLSW
jgi:hypothetical protein